MARRPKQSFIQFIIAGFVALVVGGVAVMGTFYVVKSLMSQNQQMTSQFEKEKKSLEAEINKLKSEQSHAVALEQVRAKQLIPKGTTISSEMLESFSVATASALTPDSINNPSMLIGQLTSRDIQPGEVITSQKIIDSAGMIPVTPGKRAISILVSQVGLVAGSVRPGMSVDILATFDQAQAAKTILQNVRIMDIGYKSMMATASSAASSVGKNPQSAVNAIQNAGTLPIIVEVTPREAELLTLVNKQGTFHLSLRSINDSSRTNGHGVFLGSVLGFNSGTNNSPSPAWPSSMNSTPTTAAMAPSQLNLTKPITSSPSISGAPQKNFSMEILKGASSESQSFQWEGAR